MECNKTVYCWEGLTLIYADVEGIWSFLVVPTALADRVTDDKLTLEYIRREGFTHVHNDPMVQIALLGDCGEKEFFAGNSMNNSSSSFDFRFERQEEHREEGANELVTYFANGRGQTYEHHVRKSDGVDALECWNVLVNEGDEVTVEMMASAVLNCLSPFCAENDVDRLLIHRLRTNWSAEGKLETFTAAQLQLEDSWSSYGIRQARIGQNGSMPCRIHMPFCAVEDLDAGCTWAFALEAPMSWHLDAIHHQASVSLSGGIADFESGHFRKVVKRGERFATDRAFLTAAAGGLDLACAKLQDLYAARLEVPAAEQDLPVVYNEYCCSWGSPCIAKLKPMIDECARLGVREFVVDVGWWRQDERSWYTFGDWNPSPQLFPGGIGELAGYIRQKGMIPGLWFEFEGVSCDSLLYAEHPDYLLTRDGVRIQHRERALLDFRKPEVRDYLYEKVVRLLKDNGFGYVKVDYNEPLGIGCDGAESYGEGMRRHLNCVLEFFAALKREIPGLVVEVCSSGGHRLEPKFLGLASMASFSDAHLGPEGAVIAADLHRWMLPRQMQIWAVLQREYSLPRIYFTIVKGMLGRYCLSGDLLALSAPQRAAMEQSLDFYRRLVPILREGDTLVQHTEGMTSLRRLEGVRWLVRFGKDKRRAAVWAFASRRGTRLELRDERLRGYAVEGDFVLGSVRLAGDCLTVIQSEEDELFAACVLLAREDRT